MWTNISLADSSGDYIPVVHNSQPSYHINSIINEPEELYQVHSGSFREDVLSEKYLYYLVLCAVPPISSVSAVVAEVPEWLQQALGIEDLQAIFQSI